MRVGIDIVSVSKIERIICRWGDRFLERVYSKEEIDSARKRRGSLFYQHLAGRFAVKEAIIKTLDEPIALRNISVVNTANGKPKVVYPREKFAISISHTEEYAAAVCIRFEGGEDANA